MGGHALQYTSVRLTKSDYDRVATTCVEQLRTFYPGLRVQALGSYRTKSDFGDCDILVESREDYDPYAAAKALGALEVVRNGPVTSVGLVAREGEPYGDGNVFQVDLIKMPSEAFDFALGYFGASDTGNLVGRVAHSMGLSHRHDGLFYYFRDGDYKFREVLLTRDYGEALAFLGYDPAVFAAGFDGLEDLYRYVASTSFFNRDIFLLENRNAKSRVRDKKRQVYMEFLKWCEARPALPAFHYPDDKSVWLPRFAAHFPHFQAEYDQAVKDLAILRAVKSKFNGAWVAELTGLNGKDLGAVMQGFKRSFESDEAQRVFVLKSSMHELEERVRECERAFRSEKLEASQQEAPDQAP